MSTASSTLSAIRSIRLNLPKVSYGPFFLLEAMPWLLLATVTRAQARTIHNGFSLFVWLLAEAALFLAFLLASQKLIRSAGGVTTLEKIVFSRQVKLAWSVIWRLLVLSVAAAITVHTLGISEVWVSVALLSFDGIVFFWPAPWLPLCSAFVASLVFLMIVECGMERKPKTFAIVIQFGKRARFLVPAIIFIALFLAGMNFAQHAIGSLLQPIFEWLSPGPTRNLFSVSFIFLFSYVRLLVTVLALTVAIRASYQYVARLNADGHQ